MLENLDVKKVFSNFFRVEFSLDVTVHLSMGLPTALLAHAQEDFELAAKHYQRALDQGQQDAVLFQNYGALLRAHGKDKIAREVYEKGLYLHPTHDGIRQNLANLYQATNPWRAFELHLANLYDSWSSDLRSKHFLSVLNVLESEGCILWSYQLCKLAFSCVSVQPSLLVVFYRVATHEKNSTLSSNQRDSLADIIDKKLESFSPLDKAEYYYSLSWVNLQRGDFNSAKEYFINARQILSESSISVPEDLEKAQNLNNQNSWNMGCLLLSYQQFDDGWKYFEYGLRTKALGAQKWQRALPKPFTHEEISIWRGESLTNKKILLLEEQAIGDVMQFLTLVPSLLEEAGHIGLFLSQRLISIYKRSLNVYIQQNKLSIWSFDDVKQGNLLSSEFHYQSPLGSICRYRFSNIHDYGNNLPFLLVDRTQTKKFRQKYLSLSTENKKIVGISWRGGGTSDRILQKSMDTKIFSKFLDIPGIQFVSLQYGESSKVVDVWQDQGFDVYHDTSVDPLKDMDLWLAQVAACDGVLSVANTTIHGAGGLNIPTLCLLSTQSDWRWLKDESVSRSYWYPSVGIVRQSSTNSWINCYSSVRQWLSEGMPFPTGAVGI